MPEATSNFANLRVAALESRNAAEIARLIEKFGGLEARGAKVVNVRVYHWDLPEDTGPLAENIKAIIAGDRDVLIVTSAHQVANLLRMAQQLGVEQPLRDALRRMAIASVGPTT